MEIMLCCVIQLYQNLKDMAAISSNGKSAKAHIDLTPMVDLNFLLITFFMFTTSMNKPKALKLQMPFKPSTEQSKFYESSAVTIISADSHKVYYYEGLLDNAPKMELTSYTQKGLRALLQAKQKAIANRENPLERKVQVLIKPTAGATLNDVVNVLDEMKILRIETFAIVDVDETERSAMK